MNHIRCKSLFYEEGLFLGGRHVYQAMKLSDVIIMNGVWNGLANLFTGVVCLFSSKAKSQITAFYIKKTTTTVWIFFGTFFTQKAGVRYVQRQGGILINGNSSRLSGRGLTDYIFICFIFGILKKKF